MPIYCVDNPRRVSIPDTNIDEINEINEDKVLFFPVAVNDMSWNYAKEYGVYVSGRLKSGHKAILFLTGVDIYFDIVHHTWYKTEEGKSRIDIDYFNELVKNFADAKNLRYKYTEVIETIPNNFGYRTEKTKAIRVHFDTPSHYRKFETCVCNCRKWIPMSNPDTRNYTRVVGRRYGICFSQWLEVSNFKYERNMNPTFKESQEFVHSALKHHILADISDVRNVDISLEPKVLECHWDYETYSIKSKETNSIINDTLQFISVGILFNWKGCKNICNIVIYRPYSYAKFEKIKDEFIEKIKDKVNDSTWVYIVRDTKDYVRLHIEILKKFRPDFEVGYNTFGFDYPVMKYLLSVTKMENEFVMETSDKNVEVFTGKECSCGKNCKCKSEDCKKYYYCACDYNCSCKKRSPSKFANRSTKETRKKGSGSSTYKSIEAHVIEELKLNQELSREIEYYDIFGRNPVDMFVPCYRKYYKRRDLNIKLNTMLRENGLPLKEDLPYHVLHKNWFDGEVDGTIDNITYNNGDCEGTKNLLDKLKTLDADLQLSQICKLDYISTNLRASDVKITNGMLYYFMMNNQICVEQFRNRKKRVKGEEVDAYPNRDFEFYLGIFYRHEVFSNLGANVNCYINGKHEYPITAFDFASLYPSIMMGHNISPERIIAFLSLFKEERKQLLEELDDDDVHIEKFLDKMGNDLSLTSLLYTHKNKEGEYETNEDDKGVYCKVFEELFANRKRKKNARDDKKHEMEEYEEQYILKHPNVDNLPGKKYMEKIEEELQQIPEYKVLESEHARLEGAQLATKIFMNSIYGITGNQYSVLYNPRFAGAVCSIGRRALAKSNKIAEKYGNKVAYNDTDSQYILHPEAIYRDAPKEKGKDRDRFLVRRAILYGTTTSGTERKLKKLRSIIESESKLQKYADRKKITIEQARFEIQDDIDFTVKYRYNPELTGIQKCNFPDKLLEEMRTEFDRSGKLKMVREETLFRAIFIIKKNYYGIIHEDHYVENPTVKDWLIRGLKMKKANSSAMEKEWSQKMYWDCIKNDDRNLRGIIENSLLEAPKLFTPEACGKYVCFKGMEVANSATKYELYLADGSEYLPHLSMLENIKLCIVDIPRQLNADATFKDGSGNFIKNYPAKYVENSDLELDKHYYLDRLIGICKGLTMNPEELNLPEKFAFDDSEIEKKMLSALKSIINKTNSKVITDDTSKERLQFLLKEKYQNVAFKLAGQAESEKYTNFVREKFPVKKMTNVKERANWKRSVKAIDKAMMDTYGPYISQLVKKTIKKPINKTYEQFLKSIMVKTDHPGKHVGKDMFEKYENFISDVSHKKKIDDYYKNLFKVGQEGKGNVYDPYIMNYFRMWGEYLYYREINRKYINNIRLTEIINRELF